MQFLSLLLLVPALASALPQIFTRETSYTFNVPNAYIAAHPESPKAVVFDQAQLDKFSILVPVKVTPSNEIVVTGEVDIQHVQEVTQAPADGEMSIQALDPRCPTCLAGCAIAGVLGPEGVVVCMAFCLARGYCR